MSQSTVYMTVKEAAEYANVTVSSIRYHMFESGKIDSKRVDVEHHWEPAWYVTKESVDNLYYKTREGEKQHTAKNSFEAFAEKYPNVIRAIAKNPEIGVSLASKATPDCIEAAIVILKELGYKVYKPVLSHEEV